MRKLIVLPLFLFVSFSLFAQSAFDILSKSYQKCQTIKNGYYEMGMNTKSLSLNPYPSSIKCYFSKLENDSVFPSAFRYRHDYNGDYIQEVLYTGNELVYFSPNDSSGTIIYKNKWWDYLNSIKKNYTFFSPFTDNESSPLLGLINHKHESDTSFKYIGEETINSSVCYHIIVSGTLNCESESVKILSNQNELWINKEDYIPIKYINRICLTMDNDTLYQYDEFTLEKYELNHLNVMDSISVESIPKHYKIKDYQPD